MSAEIDVISDGPLMTVTLARPDKRNALTATMYAALADALDAAEADPGVAALVLQSEGESFCAGNDIAEFLNTPPPEAGAPVLRFLQALAGTSVPLVAAIDGDAVGVGATMLLHCDFVLASDRARLRFPFVDLALVPEAGSTYLLPRRVGGLRAAELLLLGMGVGAREALALGLVSRIVPQAGLRGEAQSLGRALPAKPVGALRATKALMRGDEGMHTRAMAREAAVLRTRLVSAEARAAFAGFLARR